MGGAPLFWDQRPRGAATQEHEWLTVAIDGRSASRLDGVMLDYMDHGGFKFLHPKALEPLRLDPFNPN